MFIEDKFHLRKLKLELRIQFTVVKYYRMCKRHKPTAVNINFSENVQSTHTHLNVKKSFFNFSLLFFNYKHLFDNFPIFFVTNTEKIHCYKSKNSPRKTS